MITDRGGREMHNEQIVDIHLTGMFTGRIVQIHDGGKVIVPGRPQKEPAVVLVQVIVPVPVQEGIANWVYVIGDPEEIAAKAPGDGDHSHAREDERAKRRMGLVRPDADTDKGA